MEAAGAVIAVITGAVIAAAVIVTGAVVIAVLMAVGGWRGQQ